MKKIAMVLVFPIALIFQLNAQKKAEFDYPEDSTAEASKKAFEKQFNQGKVLYNISCGNCHNIKNGRKEIIPDFSMPQLMDYEMRMYTEHSDRLTDKHVADDEMSKIILFLRFKKKSGTDIRGKSQQTP